jgi:nucleotide-binding universal stress UspA family protein
MKTPVTAPLAPLAPDAGPPPFARILCGVNAGRPAQEAVREAIAFAAGGAALHFVAISDQIGAGPSRTALLSPHRADLALTEARHAAKEADVATTAERIADPNVVARLLEEARGHDLLVIGCPIHSRTPGILGGETAAVALHRAQVPLLLARVTATEAPFPARVVVATDATPAGRDPVHVGARIAQRHGVPLVLLHVADIRSSEARHELGVQAAAAEAVTGVDPVVLAERGHAAPRILDVAGDHEGTLLVVGSGGRRGIDSLGSVSERVGAHARGPVLVLRPRA